MVRFFATPLSLSFSYPSQLRDGRFLNHQAFTWFNVRFVFSGALHRAGDAIVRAAYIRIRYSTEGTQETDSRELTFKTSHPSPRPDVLDPQMGHFLYAAKAFDVLERLDPDPEYWEGKRGACVGVFQQVQQNVTMILHALSLVKYVEQITSGCARSTSTTKAKQRERGRGRLGTKIKCKQP